MVLLKPQSIRGILIDLLGFRLALESGSVAFMAELGVKMRGTIDEHEHKQEHRASMTGNGWFGLWSVVYLCFYSSSWRVSKAFRAQRKLSESGFYLVILSSIPFMDICKIV